MTLSSERIGDKGQRFQVMYLDGSVHEPGGSTSAQTMGWSDDAQGAENMAAAWRLRPSTLEAWVVDRHAPCQGGQAPAPHDAGTTVAAADTSSTDLPSCEACTTPLSCLAGGCRDAEAARTKATAASIKAAVRRGALASGDPGYG